jgi:hypothetical protein
MLPDRDPARVDIVEVLDLPTSLKRAISIATKQRREAQERTANCATGRGSARQRRPVYLGRQSM